MNLKDLRLPALLLFGIYAVYGCALTPLYQFLVTDIVLQNTLWLDLVDLLFQHIEIYGSAFLFAFLTRSVYRYGVAASKPMFLLAAGAILFKYLTAIIAISLLFGYIDLTGGLSSYLFSFFLELALGAFAVFLAYRLVLPALWAKKANGEENAGFLPFERLFCRKNPLQRTLFWSMLAITLIRLAAFIINDLAIAFDFSFADVPVMLLYSLILILLPGFLGYLITLRLVKIPPYQEPLAPSKE